jgi:hypothetical protein
MLTNLNNLDERYKFLEHHNLKLTEEEKQNYKNDETKLVTKKTSTKSIGLEYISSEL